MLGPQHARVDHEHRLIGRLFDLTQQATENREFPTRFKSNRSLNLQKPYRFDSAKDFVKGYANEFYPELLVDEETEFYESKV